MRHCDGTEGVQKYLKAKERMNDGQSTVLQNVVKNLHWKPEGITAHLPVYSYIYVIIL